MKKTKRYYEFGDFLRDLFKFKVQKISINAGFTCPNRDGSKGWGGCTYCNNQTFSPEYCHTEKSVTEQLEEGVRFFSRKYPDMRYLAYFQAYTNTYDRLDSLIRKYEEALAYPGVEGLIVGTRPDCMPEGLLDYFAELSQRKFVMIEYGLESTLDKTLVRINRGHTHEESESAIRRTAAKGIYTGAHLILGLPGESRDEILHHADVLSRLPITTLKLHQLQLIKNTRMAKEFKEDPSDFHLYTADEYIELVIDFIERLNPSIVVERFVSQSPKELLIAPDWGLKNFEFTAKVNKRIEERDTRQGRLFQVSGDITIKGKSLFIHGCHIDCYRAIRIDFHPKHVYILFGLYTELDFVTAFLFRGLLLLCRHFFKRQALSTTIRSRVSTSKVRKIRQDRVTMYFQ